MILLAVHSAVWLAALCLLVLCVVLRLLYVVGLRKQGRRRSVAHVDMQAARKARWVVSQHDPYRALRSDAVDPL